MGGTLDSKQAYKKIEKFIFKNPTAIYSGMWIEIYPNAPLTAPKYCKNIEEVLEWQEAFEMVYATKKKGSPRTGIRVGDNGKATDTL